MARNIVLVTADSLRADHCGFIDSDADLTPTLDELASDGVVFENAIATGPRTPSSMPAAFTGEYLPPITIDDTNYWQQLRGHIRRHMGRHRTLTERLRAAGYTTIGFSVNPWTENTGFNSGFDRFYTLNSEFLEGYGSLVFRLADWALRGNRFGDRIKWFNKREWFIRWTDFYGAILRQIERTSEPYFIWIFLLDTHQPYISPTRYREEVFGWNMYYATFKELLADDRDISRRVDRWLRQAYRDSVRSIDGFVNQIWEDVRSDDPVLVFHSDHGEAFGLHGTYGHKQELFRENLHVPLMIHDGQSVSRISDAISLIRLPEIVRPFRQRDRFDPSSVASKVAVSSTEDGQKQSVGTASWNYIRDGYNISLFDIQNDPREEQDVSQGHPEAVDYFERILSGYYARADEKRRISTAVRDRLIAEGLPVEL